MQQLHAGKQVRGFTIVEVMAVVVISGLILTAAAPTLQQFVRNNQASVESGRLVASLNLARSEALRRGLPVSICPISNTFNPTTAPNEAAQEWPCQATTTWDAWKVFVDPNLNGTENFSAGWPVLEYVRVEQLGSITSNVSGIMYYDAQGIANVNPSSTRAGWTWSASVSSGEWTTGWSYNSAFGGSYTNRTFTIVPPGCSSGNNARLITVSNNGSITMASAAC